MTESDYRQFCGKMLEYGGKTAFTYYVEDDVFHKTYRDLIKDIERFCTILRTEGVCNSRVVFWAPNCYTWIPLSIAMTALNNTVLFVDCNSSEMLNHVIERYHATYVVASKTTNIDDALLINKQDTYPKKYTVEIDELTVSEISKKRFIDDADAIADYILFTSGSAGIPKGVLIDSSNMFYAAECTGKNFSLYKNTLLVLPLNHIYGYCAITLSHLFRGEEIIISHGVQYLNRELKRFEPENVFMVPTLLYSYYDLNIKLNKSIREVFGRNLRALYVGGGKLDAAYIEKYRKFGIEVLNGYGMTEMCGCIAIMHERMTIIDSAGEVYPEVHFKVVDGEIWVNSPYHMFGYYDGEVIERVIEDGWYKTGDTGYIENGCIFVQGRIDQIISLPNGKNIYGPDLENIIRDISGVAKAAIKISCNRLMVTIAINNEKKRDMVLEAVKEMNHSLPSYMKITDIEIVQSEE